MWGRVGKIAAVLSESILANVCCAGGGGAFSASCSSAMWNHDVRALACLRPPWALAFDRLTVARRPAE
ncbi:MAG: hypothetical protein HOI41_19380 [Acidimicrobiaceae bacterium]|nr:hypothetical protein [Acidimicrobiaceae bacterium]